MDRRRLEELGSSFLGVFSAGLALQLAYAGMEPRQGGGAIVAVAASSALAMGVRLWPARLEPLLKPPC